RLSYHYPPILPRTYPPRRSSDLDPAVPPQNAKGVSIGDELRPLEGIQQDDIGGLRADALQCQQLAAQSCGRALAQRRKAAGSNRSEEHTSELQSRFEIVCRRPLE